MRMSNLKMKMSAVMLSAVMLLLLGGTFAVAAPGGNCTKATILRIGAKNNGNAIELRNDAGENFTGWAAGVTIWLVPHPDNTDAMLATALTAFSLGKQLTVVAPNSTYESWGYVTQLFVNK